MVDVQKLMTDTLEKVGSVKACYTVSKIIAHILELNGIKSKVVFVQGMITNDRAEHIRISYGLERWDNEIPENFRDYLIAGDGWTMGVGVGIDPIGLPNFHAVVYLPDTDEVIDATMHQMSRPKWDIHLTAFYGSAEDYQKLYSAYFLFRLCDVEQQLLKLIHPKLVRKPEECGTIIRELEGVYVK